MDTATPTLEDTAEISRWCVALYHALNGEYEIVGPFVSEEEARTWKKVWLSKLSIASVVKIQDPLDAENYLLSRS